MPLIKLPKFPLKSSQKGKGGDQAPLHTFLCLMFVNHSVQAALWKVEGEKVRTLSNSSLKTFENDEDGLIQADQALQELGSDSENIGEVVFGFDPLWVDDAGLMSQKKPFIKAVAENLGLNPVGFVVIPDALVQQIVAQDSLASQVLVYLQDDTVFIYLLKQGKLVHQLSVGRSGDIVQDVVEGLARFAGELKGQDTYLPAKLMLASVTLTAPEMDDAQQQISNYNWSENHPFVQAPVVESMAALDVLYAVVEQGGAAVAQSKGLQGKHVMPETSINQTENEDFGFESVDAPVEQGDNFTTPAEGGQVTSFGVPISRSDLPAVSEKPIERGEKSRAAGRRLKMPVFLKKLYRWYDHHPHKKTILGGFIGGVLALLLMLIGWVVMSYQVAVSLQLTEKVIAKDVEITIDPTLASSNVARQILKGELETMEVTGRETAATTGVKLVGEQAKGTVTLFNKTTAVKTFTEGTRLSAGTLAFTLDTEVTVASASVEENEGGTGETKNYGQTDVAVTASAIGAESNLGKGTELIIASFDIGTYSATAKDAFSGGSSREVRVISQEDQDNVLGTLTNKLKDEAQQKFNDQSGNGIYYALTSRIAAIEENYDGEVGDEADQVTLDLTLEASAVKYQSSDLRPLLEEALKDDIPEGYRLIDEEPEFLSDTRQEATASTRVVLDANVIAKARPPFNQEEVIQTILGLPLRELPGKLAERGEIESAQYVLKPAIARLFVRRVPKDAQRVQLEISNQTR